VDKRVGGKYKTVWSLVSR